VTAWKVCSYWTT